MPLIRLSLVLLLLAASTAIAADAPPPKAPNPGDLYIQRLRATRDACEEQIAILTAELLTLRDEKKAGGGR